jgi:hypothetical protein
MCWIFQTRLKRTAKESTDQPRTVGENSSRCRWRVASFVPLAANIKSGNKFYMTMKMMITMMMHRLPASQPAQRTPPSGEIPVMFDLYRSTRAFIYSPTCSLDRLLN